MFKLETMGGDASLLHLASRIDKGIRHKLKENESPRARKYRQIDERSRPLRYLMLFAYVLLTQFEKPAWCLNKMKLKYEENDLEHRDFNDATCNDLE